MSIRESVTTDNFFEIAKNNEYFIWHFLQKNQAKNDLGFFSYFDNPKNEVIGHSLKYIVDNIDIPYFESYTEESIDFLINIGIDGKLLFKPEHTPNFYVPREFFYRPFILGFKKFRITKSTTEVCYCPEGFFEILLATNPEILLNSNFD